MRRICVDPEPSSTFSGLMPCFLAISSVTSAVVGELIAAQFAEAAAHGVEDGAPGPSGFSLLARMIGDVALAR